MTGASAPAGGHDRLFLIHWAWATAAAAALVSACDAVLLQRSKNYFTGGFLSIDHLEGPGEAALFVAVSLLADAAVIGLAAALVAILAARARLGAPAALTAGTLSVAGALLYVDVVSYEVLRYLGDGFDLALALDLTGGRVDELLAVTSAHLVNPVLMAVFGAALAAAAVWAVDRAARPASRVPLRASVLRLPAVLAGLGFVVMTAAATASDTLENGLLRKPAGRVLAAVANTITDVDGDGTGLVGRLSDPDPFDAAVYPYALDWPGNGVDEDGVGGDLPAATRPHAEPEASRAPWRRRGDVVLVLLESFRADLIGARLDGRPITPVLNHLASAGVSLSQAYSHNGYTVQSRYHLLSGLLAGAPETTLIDEFRAQGYAVGYFSAQDESFGGAEYDVGFARADEAYDARRDRARRYTSSTTPGSLAVPSGAVLERVVDFLERRRGQTAPLFMIVSFHDTHFPYAHAGIETLVSTVRLPRARIAPDERPALWATYANTAANVDRAVGVLLDAVTRARGAIPGVIVTADHGESLFDEGFLGHGYGLNDAQTRVPLIAAHLPLTLPEPFGQVDLRDAIGAALRLPPDAPAVPVVQAAPERRVFQYLGTLSRPRQIAVLSRGSRLIYDFRTRRVRAGGDAWIRPVDLSPALHREFLQLVHEWEWLKLKVAG